MSGLHTRIRKYKTDTSWSMMINGCLTGGPPVHVNVSSSATSSQNNHWMRGQNIRLCSFVVRGIVIIARIRIEKIRANMHIIYWGGFVRLHMQIGSIILV